MSSLRTNPPFAFAAIADAATFRNRGTFFVAMQCMSLMQPFKGIDLVRTATKLSPQLDPNKQTRTSGLISPTRVV